MPLMNLVQHLVERGLGYDVDWGGTAAWAQAAGTLVALALAIELPRRATRRDIRIFRDTVSAYCAAVRDGVHAVAVLDGTLHEVADATAIRTVCMEVNLPSLIAAFEQLPLAQLGNRDAVDHAIRFAGAARAFLNTPPPHSLTVEEATLILVNGRTPRRHAVDQVMARYDGLVLALLGNR
jgi:hypothetical protein